MFSLLLKELNFDFQLLPPLPREFFLSSPREKWAQRTCAGCPNQRYVTGETGKLQARERVGIVDDSYGHRARGVSIGGRFVLSKTCVQDEETRHIAICSSYPRVAYPDVKFQVRYLVLAVGIMDPFAHWRGGYSGKVRFIEPQGENGHRRPVPGAPQQRYVTEELHGRDRAGIVEGSYSYRDSGISIRRNVVLSTNLGYKTRRVAIWMSPAAVRHGRVRKLQRRDHVGILNVSCGYRTRGVSIRGRFV